MRPTRFGAVLCAAALAFLVGCGGPVPNGTAADPKATGDSAIDAGLSFGDGVARDEMAIQIAKEASGIGNADAVRHALQKISDAAKHDETASACALTLARLSKPADAADIARTIGNANTRAATLSGIAASAR